MQNKGIVQKRSRKLKSDKVLKKKVKSRIGKESLYYSLYHSLHTPFRNLVNVTLQECKFNFLPKDFGTLHHLQEVTLSRNYVVNTTQSAWEWLEQAPMRCNLKSLEITYYDLFQLPLQITCLKNLTTLYMTRMRISSLPKEFGNLPLVDLDLSYNNLRKSEQFSWEWSMQAPIRHTLRYLNLSHNYIKFIPKELGTLPHLMCLNLSSNHLGKSDCNTWEWLEQTAIRIRLCDLNLSDNLLMELPPQIGKLNTLFFLNLKCNKLKYLPQSLANLKNLTFLDLSDNDLLYLPGSIAQSWAFINVNGNPFNLDDDSYDNSTTNLEVPSLLDCSAEIFLKYRLNYTNGLPQELVKYLDNKRYCFFCVTPCFRYYGKRFINYLKYKKILDPKFIPVLSLHIEKAKFECYACSSECAKRLKFD